MADCHTKPLSSSRLCAEKPTQARYSEILHKQSRCAGPPIARFLPVRVNVQLIRIDRFPKSPGFDTFWPREHGERSKEKGKVDRPHRNALRYVGEFFQSGQAIVAGGRTKTPFPSCLIDGKTTSITQARFVPTAVGAFLVANSRIIKWVQVTTNALATSR
jgi:hypothetical protein